MLIFNITFALLAIYFAYRGGKLFLKTRDVGRVKESIIALVLILLYGLICARSLLLIEVGPEKIQQAGLLLSYYLYLGTIILQMLISDFIIKFVYDSITKTTDT